MKISAKHKKEVITLEFDKEKAESMNKKLWEFKAPSYPVIWIVINILYFITWGILLFGLYNIIIYYISLI